MYYVVNGITLKLTVVVNRIAIKFIQLQTVNLIIFFFTFKILGLGLIVKEIIKHCEQL